MRRSKGYQWEAHNYNTGLQEAEMRAVAPTIFSPSRDPERTAERFGHVGAWNIIDAVGELGYVPVQVMQSNARRPGGLMYARNLTRLRLIDDLGSSRSEVVELVLTDADNGTAAFDFRLGYVRYLCMNGCIFGTFMNSLHLTHRGDIFESVLNGVYNLTQQYVTVYEVIESMKSITLPREDQLWLAEQ